MRQSDAAVALCAILALFPVSTEAQTSRRSSAQMPPASELRADPDWELAPVLDPVDAYRVYSDVLGEERRIFVSLPPSHARTTRQYPVILVFDGEWNIGTVAAAAKALSAAGHGPEAVVVGIENTDRLRDLSPPGLPVSGNDGSGRADLFLDFLEHELRPMLTDTFRAGGPVFLVGHSSGGLFVAYAAAIRPETFGSVLALDAPMHLENGRAAEPLLRLAETTDVPVSIVSLESQIGWQDESWAATERTAPASWTLVREPLEGESHQTMVWPGSYLGLRTLFAPFSPTAERGTSPAELLDLYDRGKFGDGLVPPSERLLRNVVADQIISRDLAAAGETLTRLVEAYGDSDVARRLRAQIDEADELEGPRVEELQAAPRASADAVRAVVGEWQGYTQMTGAMSQSPLGLSVRIEDGVPVGEFSFNAGPAHEVEYVAVEGNEIHLGYMNRMRPRGMVVYEGVVKEDVFEGFFVIRGVVFRMPDGSEIPEVRFHLERIDLGSR